MPTGYVQIPEIQVMRVRANMKGKGPPEAFALLESRLPTLKGRMFYGTFRMTPEGGEYWACVARIEEDDPKSIQLETGTIPGGWYARKKVQKWEKVVQEGKLPAIFEELIRSNADNIDESRPSVEFYRSRDELLAMMPVKGPPPSGVD
jgi:hypothetical protein